MLNKKFLALVFAVWVALIGVAVYFKAAPVPDVATVAIVQQAAPAPAPTPLSPAPAMEAPKPAKPAVARKAAPREAKTKAAKKPTKKKRVAAQVKTFTADGVGAGFWS